MKETTGVLIALLSSALGGGAAVATRFLVADFDPITLAMVRFGGGALLLIPVALLLRPKLPPRPDWPAAALLGFLFYGVFFVVYVVALTYTTVARGTLALSTLPLMTMVVGAVLGLEKLSARKTFGVLVAMGGVAVALSASLAAAPEGAWRGDLIMAAGTVCMALYNVYSRPYTQRSSPLGFLTFSMVAGGGALIAIGLATARVPLLLQFDTAQALAGLYLAAGGGAFGFFLWVVALKYASPTRVANTITINPLIAMAFGAALLGEAVTWPLILGLVAVCAGVFIATTNSRPAART